MDFFYPLKLGIPKKSQARFEHNDRDRTEDEQPRIDYDEWRESESPSEGDYDELQESSLLDELCSPGPLRHRLRLILGEPGAGKSTLLRKWHERWITKLVTASLGLRIPVLVRLRDLTKVHVAGKPDEIADRLWNEFGQKAAMEAAKETASASIVSRPLRLFSPVWLLDGLDEAPIEPTDRIMWEFLAALPGEVVLTCRTAAYRQMSSLVEGLIQREYRILGLRPSDQAAFLTKALEAEGQDPTKSTELVRQLNINPALRPLATIPLLLRLAPQLMGRVSSVQNRADFYVEAVNALWRNSLDQERSYDLAIPRDAALAALAEALDLRKLHNPNDMIKAPYDLLTRVGVAGGLRVALRSSGLLQFDERRLCAYFPHLTFQEFYLARSWQGKSFGSILEKHWSDARYEEALGLLVALHWRAGRAKAVEDTLDAFVRRWYARHAQDRKKLWQLRRSPLVVALTLLGRAGVNPSNPLLSAVDAPIEVWLNLSGRLNLPADTLMRLAKNNSRRLRRQVASNPTTSPEVFALLANDESSLVRTSLAQNPSAPPDILTFLAKDPVRLVRHGVALNAATPVSVLVDLAKDSDRFLRRAVAMNIAMPVETLMDLTADGDARVRQLAAYNASLPSDFLASLISRPDIHIHRGIAGNRASPANLLQHLAQSPDAEVRWSVAYNRAAPPDLLLHLGEDTNVTVRRALAANVVAPSELFEMLVRDQDASVRADLAANASSSSASLALLAQDIDVSVRREVACNARAPIDVLVSLAGDPDIRTRTNVATNPRTPLNSLRLLATDDVYEVREGLAKNSGAPPELLVFVTEHSDPGVAGRFITEVEYWVESDGTIKTSIPDADAGMDLSYEPHPSVWNARMLPEDLWPKHPTSRWLLKNIPIWAANPRRIQFDWKLHRRLTSSTGPELDRDDLRFARPDPGGGPEENKSPHHMSPTVAISDSGEEVAEIVIEDLPIDESVILLESYAGWNDEPGAKTLVETLSRLPLAIEQAAAYCKYTKTSFTDYSARADRLIIAEPLSSSYPSSIAATVHIAMELATSQAAAAEQLMAFLGQCAKEEGVPIELIVGAIVDLTERNAALLVLKDLLLVRHEPFEDGTPAVIIHPFVRAVVRTRAKAHGYVTSSLQLIRARLTEIYPLDGDDNPRSWPLCGQLTPHVLSVHDDLTLYTKEVNSSGRAPVWGRIAQSVVRLFKPTRSVPDISDGTEWKKLLERTCGYLICRANYYNSQALHQYALAITVNTLGRNHPLTAVSLRNLGYQLLREGDLARARTMFEGALAFRQRTFGHRHPKTAESLSDFGRILSEQGDFGHARSALEDALMTTEMTLGSESREIIQALDYLASVVGKQGEIGIERQLRERALAVSEKVCGVESLETMHLLGNLGILLADTGDLIGAHSSFERALTVSLKIRETEGTEWREDTTLLINFGTLLEEQGDFAAAWPLYERALEAVSKSPDSEPPKTTAEVFRVVAKFLRDQGAFSAARTLFERALDIAEKAFGPEHLAVVNILCGIAILLRRQDDYTGARALLERARAITKKLDPEHPDAVWVQHELDEIGTSDETRT
jgi:tetratricopeptide (TPR) repeat protein